MSPAERRQMMLAGPIVPTILTLAAPNVLNVAMQSLVSISDSWFVAQLGLVDLAALRLVFPTQMALGQMSAGAMGGGISSSVARALGAGNRAAAEAAAAHALVIALGMAALFAVVLVGFGRPIYGALGGSGAALDRAVAFSSVLFLGCFAHWIANTLASVLRGTGDMKTPGYALVATAALQIPLSGGLTLGWFGLPKLGIAGPAASAVISFALAALWMLSRLVGPRAALRLHWPKAGFRWAAFRDILKVGLIACLVVILTNGTVLLVTGLIGRAGDAAIAGYGIGSRLEYMLVPISFGIGAALTALVGTNIGARQYARAQRLAWIGALMAGGIAAAIGIIVAIQPDLWLGPVHQRSRRAGVRPDVPAHRRAGVRLLRPRHGALFREPGDRRDDLAGGRQPLSHPDRGMRQPAGARRAGLGPAGLFVFVALGIVSFSAVLAFSTTRPAWRPQ
jgi:putative MATE family efflux protein